ncbi:hypothetical protein D9M72_511800 [compost metagenome]
MVVERQRAAISGEFVGAQPILPHDDRVGRDTPYLFDEAREMPGDLGIGRAKIRFCRGDCLRLSEPVDLNDPGDDRAAGRLPDEGCRKAGREDERAECHEPPVFRLDAGRADAIVPDLGGALIGCLGLWRLSVMRGGSSEGIHERSPSERLTEEPPPWASPERIAWAVA